MKFSEEYATFKLPFEFEDLTVMNGGETFKLARYKDKVVLAMPNPYSSGTWYGKVFFEQRNLPVVIEMLSDVLDGKLQDPDMSRFPCKDGGFKYRDENDKLFIGAQTVWAHQQREAPTQVFIDNNRKNKFGASGEQYGMSLNFTPEQAKGLLKQLKQIPVEIKNKI